MGDTSFGIAIVIKKKMQLMNWKEVIKPKFARGLGSGNLELINWALLARWWWMGKKKNHYGGR